MSFSLYKPHSSADLFIDPPKSIRSCNIVKQLTCNITNLYHSCSKNQYDTYQDQYKKIHVGFILQNQYKIEELIGTGGFSKIYKCLDLYKQRIYALKVYETQYESIGSQEALFLTILNKNDNCQSNIIHCYSSFLYHHHFCLVLDYYPFSLHTIINSFHLLQPSNSTSEPCYYDVPVPTQDSSLYAMKEYSHDLNHSLPFLRSISYSFFRSLSYLHEQGFIHADIKPENILLNENRDTTFLIDFSNMIPSHFLSYYTTTFSKPISVQAPVYRAPEIIFGASPSPAIDIWSAGCLLAELYTKTVLFKAVEPSDLLLLISNMTGPFHRSLYAQYPLYSTFKDLPIFEEESSLSHHNLSQYMFSIPSSFSSQDSDFSDFLDLIKQCLFTDPSQRITAPQVLFHPFFACYHSPLLLTTPSVLPSLIQAKKQKQSYSLLKQQQQYSNFIQFISSLQHQKEAQLIQSIYDMTKEQLTEFITQYNKLRIQFQALEIPTQSTPLTIYKRLKNTLKDVEDTIILLNTLYKQHCDILLNNELSSGDLLPTPSNLDVSELYTYIEDVQSILNTYHLRYALYLKMISTSPLSSSRSLPPAPDVSLSPTKRLFSPSTETQDHESDIDLDSAPSNPTINDSSSDEEPQLL